MVDVLYYILDSVLDRVPDIVSKKYLEIFWDCLKRSSILYS